MKSYPIETGNGRTQTRVLETGAGPKLLYLHSAGGVVENDPFLEALGQQFHVYEPSLPTWRPMSRLARC